MDSVDGLYPNPGELTSILSIVPLGALYVVSTVNGKKSSDGDWFVLNLLKSEPGIVNKYFHL